MDTKRKWMAEFRNPGSEFRGAPFWAWNGKLEPQELRRQIRIMKEMGLGGFFMHSRVGLDTAYLSREWFECVNACMDEAEKLGMRAWLYDEDRWPSGAAGGLVTKNPKHRLRQLRVRILKSVKEMRRTKGTLAVFAARVDGAVARDVRPVPPKAKIALADGEVLLHFDVIADSPSDWYNGYTYLDTLNHESVGEFIRVTHEAYRKQCGERFGKRCPGIFTDEPNFGSKLPQNPENSRTFSLPWTPQLPAVFRKRYGYDLIPRLPEIVYDVEGHRVTTARYHYHDCVTHLFVDSFARQIGEWCGKNDMLFTGHVLAEDTLTQQCDVVGSCMRFYEHMQAPGMDLLTEHWRVFVTAKQVSSAARQFGRKWRLSETYGCTGWDFPFAGHKTLGDWQFALGINLRCQHLAWYTMLAEAKRDYPGAISYQSPWWSLYSKVEDYFARIGSVMTRGAEIRDLLVIHPIESAWLTCKIGWHQAGETRRTDREFADLSNTLLGGHIDFDYGDEELLSRYARIVRKGGAAKLRVAKAAYRAVMVPPQTTMRRTTLELLKRFRRAGGTVVFAGSVAQYVDALASTEVEQLAAACIRVPAKGQDLIKAVEPAARRVWIMDENGKEITALLYLLREDNDRSYLFVCNTSEDFVNSENYVEHDGMVRDRKLAFRNVRIRGFAGCAGKPIELDPETGGEFAANAKRVRSGWEISTSFPALGSRVFVIPKKAAALNAKRRPVLNTVGTEILKARKWDYSLSEANVLVLDRCKYKIGGQKWAPAAEVLKVDDAIRAALALSPRGGAMVQPWARPKLKEPRTIPVSLSYEFHVESLPSGDVFLALEQPHTFRITFNGQPVSTDSQTGWWTDRSLRRIPLDPIGFRLGANEIRLEIDFPENHSGLEIMYLLGWFGTRVDGTDVTVTKLPQRIAIGDWGGQGLAFYAGHVAYQRRIQPKKSARDRVFVCVPEYRGVAVRVLVDGEQAGVIAWEPNEVEITRLLKDKPSELAIEVLGHRRNSHGPLHNSEKWPHWTGPWEYKDPNRWFEGYQLVPCGLMRAPRIEVRRAR